MGSAAPRILLLHNILWAPYKAPALSELEALCRGQGMELLVLHLAPKGKRQSHLGSADRQMHRYRYRVLFDEYLEEVPMYRLLPKILRELAAFDPDVIVVPGYGAPASVAIAFAKLFRKRLIMAVDSTETDRPRSYGREFAKGWLVRACDAYYCYGSRSKDYLAKLGARESRIQASCQAADNREIATLHTLAFAGREEAKKDLGLKEKNFIFVGRLAREKNLELLIRVFGEVKAEAATADWGLLFLGEGDDGPRLQELTKRLQVPDVHFLGGRSWREVPQLLALADVLVLPSLSEPWGMVVNEAMACGMPVVVSRRCGSADDLLVEGENGFVFDPTQPWELREILSRFVQQQVDIQGMGGKSRDIISQFTPLSAARKMLEGIHLAIAVAKESG